jgi:aspartyl protease family protein
MQNETEKPLNPEARLGKSMILLGWLLMLGLLTFYFNSWLKERENPNRQPISSSENGINQLILERNYQHHYLTDGTINGINVTFLVDTGATTVSIPAHLATRLDLKPGAVEVSSTANGTVETRATIINELKIGAITLYDVRANINPGMRDDEILLGMSALKNIEFTHKNGVLTLKQY